MIEQGYILILKLKWGDDVPPLYLAEEDRMKFEHDINKAHVFYPHITQNENGTRVIQPTEQTNEMHREMLQMFPGAGVCSKLVDKETTIRDHQTLEVANAIQDNPA
jgi:hypothetical protein